MSEANIIELIKWCLVAIIGTIARALERRWLIKKGYLIGKKKRKILFNERE